MESGKIYFQDHILWAQKFSDVFVSICNLKRIASKMYADSCHKKSFHKFNGDFERQIKLRNHAKVNNIKKTP